MIMYGILGFENKFIVIDHDEKRLLNTLPFLPHLDAKSVKQYHKSEVEQSYTGAWYLKGYAPKIPPEVILERAKLDRTDAVSKITVEVDGMTFDGDEVSQGRMNRAVVMARSQADITNAAIDEKIKALKNNMALDDMDRLGKISALEAQRVSYLNEKTKWVLADNTVAEVTIRQLADAAFMAGQRQTELWTKPYEQA